MSGYIQRKTPIARRGKSETSKCKARIQALLRQIVMKRDGGCILRDKRHCGAILGATGHVFQADHLITRSNSATYADPRLVVCVCKSCHGWKSLGSNLRKKQYDELVRSILPPDRVALWDKAENESWRATKVDWTLEELALQQVWKSMNSNN
jgi:hypothetical protein